MSLSTEASIQRAIIGAVYRRYEAAFIYKVNDRFAIGIPDLYVCIKGRNVWFEIKKPGEKLRPAQIMRQRKIRRAGGECYGVESVEEVLKILSTEKTS